MNGSPPQAKASSTNTTVYGERRRRAFFLPLRIAKEAFLKDNGKGT
jgi:hypothetical protein